MGKFLQLLLWPSPWHCHSEFSGGRHYFYAPSGGGDESVQGFHSGILSGVVEPVGALLTILAATLLVPALPYLLSFAAGAMLYVVVEELIPEANLRHDHETHGGTFGVMAGFLIMMILDVALG